MTVANNAYSVWVLKSRLKVYIKGFVYSLHLSQQLQILVDLNMLICSECEISVTDRKF
jgi:hypothetical protein